MERYPASGAVIITGAAQGIGRRMALTLVAEGVDVCIADWNEEKGNSVATEPTPGKKVGGLTSRRTLPTKRVAQRWSPKPLKPSAGPLVSSTTLRSSRR